jgi:hypothetical protein
MATLTRSERKLNRKIGRIAWFAGISLFLLEISFCVNYLQTGIQQHAPNLLSLMPMAAMFTVRFVGHLAQNFASIEYALRLLPLTVVPFALMVAGLLFERRAVAGSASPETEYVTSKLLVVGRRRIES